MNAIELPSEETTRAAGEAIRAFSTALKTRRPTLVERRRTG